MCCKHTIVLLFNRTNSCVCSVQHTNTNADCGFCLVFTRGTVLFFLHMVYLVAASPTACKHKYFRHTHTLTNMHASTQTHTRSQQSHTISWQIVYLLVCLFVISLIHFASDVCYSFCCAVVCLAAAAATAKTN